MTIFRDTGLVANGIYLIDSLIWGIEKQHAVYVIKSSEKTALIDTAEAPFSFSTRWGRVLPIPR